MRESESAVVVTAAHAHAVHRAIECHHRDDYPVKRPCSNSVPVPGFPNAVAIANDRRFRAKLNEKHFAFAQNARHEELLATCPGGANETIQVYFVMHRKVHANTARAGKQPRSQQLANDGVRRSVTFGRSQTSPRFEAAPAYRWCVRHPERCREISGRGRGASRMCRYGPSLSNRSNKWGQP